MRDATSTLIKGAKKAEKAWVLYCTQIDVGASIAMQTELKEGTSGCTKNSVYLTITG